MWPVTPQKVYKELVSINLNVKKEVENSTTPVPENMECVATVSSFRFTFRADINGPHEVKYTTTLVTLIKSLV